MELLKIGSITYYRVDTTIGDDKGAHDLDKPGDRLAGIR